VLSSEEFSAGAMSFFGFDVWNFQEVRLIDAVVLKNWQVVETFSCINCI